MLSNRVVHFTTIDLPLHYSALTPSNIAAWHNPVNWLHGNFMQGKPRDSVMVHKQNRSTSSLHPLAKTTLAQIVEGAIKLYILNEKLEPGDILPSERQFAEALAVSRSTVRKALDALIDEGLIVKEVGKGIYLRQSDPAAVSQGRDHLLAAQSTYYTELLEARAAVEVGAIGFAVHRITEEELHQLEQCVSEFEQRVASGESVVETDIRFHRTLVGAARNVMLLQWMSLVEEAQRVVSYQYLSEALQTLTTGIGQDSGSEHRSILEAVRQRDAEKARQRLIEHIKDSPLLPMPDL